MFSNRSDEFRIDYNDTYSKALPQLWHAVLKRIRTWHAMHNLRSEIQTERRELSALPDHLLQDIGITRANADKESARTKYDLPKNRVDQL